MTFACRAGGATGAISNPFAYSTNQVTTASPGTVITQVSFLADGTMIWSSGPGGASFWFSPTTADVGANYWVRCTVNSGDTPTSSTTGVWHSIASTVSFTWVQLTVGQKSGNYTFEISTDSGGSTIVASRTADISATVT